jgi:hypothetical protein
LREARSRFSPRRALLPLVGLLDRSSRAARDRPDPADDATRYPSFPWDLRTLILLFPPETPLRFMNLNLLLGPTGAPFDRPGELGALRADGAVDLQFCLEGRKRCATYKRYHSIDRELSYRPGAVALVLGERLRFEGSWPVYAIEYRQPEAGLSCSLRFEAFEDLHWWARAPWLYCHYTSFGSCRVDWRWESESGVLEVPALHDHGWGRNLLPLGVPLEVFRYEVLRVPAEAEEPGGFAICLWTEGPFGLELKQAGLLRRQLQRGCTAARVEGRVLEWATFDNHAGRPCRVPHRWLGRCIGAGTGFEYEAQRSTEPRAIFGNGFLCGFDYQGVWRGATQERFEGEGYSEQLGWVVGGESETRRATRRSGSVE